MNDYKKECLIKDILTIRYGKGVLSYDDVDVLYIVKLNELIENDCFGCLLEELANSFKWAISDAMLEVYLPLFKKVQFEILEMIESDGKENERI